MQVIPSFFTGQPFASGMHTSTAPPPVSQTFPAVKAPVIRHALGAAGQVQAAFGDAPAQGLPVGHVVGVACWHPFASAAHVTTSLPEQVVALAAPAASQAATFGQVQPAPPAGPPQGLAAGQLVVGVATRQPEASRLHVTTWLVDEQNVPVVLAQIAGAAGHEHDAAGNCPVHGISAEHMVGVPSATQPLPSTVHVWSMPPEQNDPAPPSQPAAGAGHAQRPLGLMP